MALAPCVKFKSNPKHNKPYNVSIWDTLRTAVSNRLRDLNFDPETYISEDYTEELDLSKRRARGLKVVEKFDFNKILT